MQYKCRECSFETRTSIEYKKHLSAVHTVEKNIKKRAQNPIIYKCQHCSFKTNVHYKLADHISLTHSIGQEAHGLYKCLHCPFRTKYVTDHMKHLYDEHSKSIEVSKT